MNFMIISYISSVLPAKHKPRGKHDHAFYQTRGQKIASALQHSIMSKTGYTQKALSEISDVMEQYKHAQDPKTQYNPKQRERVLDQLDKQIEKIIDHYGPSLFRKGKLGSSNKYLEETLAESIMFGLMLFSIVLMISDPVITGFAILTLPVYVNLPLILGVVIFVLDLIIIERWFRKRN